MLPGSRKEKGSQDYWKLKETINENSVTLSSSLKLSSNSVTRLEEKDLCVLVDSHLNISTNLSSEILFFSVFYQGQS